MSDPLPTTMIAAFCDAPGAPLELREVALPVPAQGQILVRLESCGVCHSDLHLRDGDEDLPQDFYPLILGHEGIGRVVQLGPDTPRAPALGTRVGLPWIFDTCQSCRPCLTGQEPLCPANTARGVQRHGAFAQYALAEAAFCPAIPDGIDPVSGAPLLCAGLTAWSALRKTRIEPGRTVLIVGAGGLGQYGILIAKARGAQVIVVDRDPAKLAIARNLGADLVLPADEDAVQKIRTAGGADCVLNFAPSPAVWPLIKASVNPMSDIVAIALIHDPVDLSLMWLIDGGHRVFGSSVGSRAEMNDFLAFAARHPLPVSVEPVSFANVNAALDRLKAADVAGRLCIDFTL